MQRLIALMMSLTAELPMAKDLDDFVPATAPNCTVEDPPRDSGVMATHGDLFLVYPRNNAIPDNYTGCQLSWWIKPNNSYWPVHTIYFKEGQVAIYAVYELFGLRKSLGEVCGPKGILYSRSQDKFFCGSADEKSKGLGRRGLPTWPKTCIENESAPVCKAEAQ